MILQKEIIMQQPRDPESKAKSSYFIHKDRCLSTTFCSAYIGRTLAQGAHFTQSLRELVGACLRMD